MDLSYLLKYVNIVILGICLCIGYIIKNILPGEKINRFIPLIMAMIGLVLKAWMCMSITPDVILEGFVSGLASTGLHQAFVKLLEFKNGGKGNE